METNDLLLQIEKFDLRIPMWELRKLSKRKCPFCDEDNESLIRRPDKLPVAYCKQCGCWYVSQIPDEQSIVDFYNNYYFRHRPSDLTKKTASEMIALSQKASAIDWQVQLLVKSLGDIKNKRILEIGCGLCKFLLKLRAIGADVIGCDLSPEACKFANEELNIKVHEATLQQCIPQIGMFDAVVMRDFIEHPVNPLIDIEGAISLLKPGGIVLIHTPNGGEAGVDKDSAKIWDGLKVDLEHLQYLSPKTINYLAGKYQIAIERLGAYGYPRFDGIRLDQNTAFKKILIKVKAIKMFRLMKKMIVLVANVKKALNCEEKKDPRLGTYHLFVILKKI